jgi:hypothetical protein
VVQIALVIAGVFVAIIAVPAAAIKYIGEMINPHGALRQQALVKLHEIEKIQADLFENVGPALTLTCDGLNIVNSGFDVERLFKERILKGTHHATDNDLAFTNLNGGAVANMNRAIASLGPPEHLIKIAELRAVWEGAWRSFNQKIQVDEDYSKEEATIRKLVSKDEETAQKTDSHLEQIKKTREFTKKIASTTNESTQKLQQARTAYNQILAQIIN